MVVSIRDVAARAGVSVGTVSNVLNRPDAVSATTVERVREAIAELGYVRNDAARQLRAGRSRSIGLVVLDSANPFFAEVSRGAEEEAAAHGLAVLVGNSDERPEREAGYLELFEQQRVSGVLISPIAERFDMLLRLRDNGIPVVLVDRAAPGSGLSSVAVDDVRGGYLAARHLVETGRRRIVYVGGPQTLRQVADRLAGARAAIAEAAGAQLEIVTRPSLSVLEGRAAAQEILARPARDRPDAVFAANDLLATGALQAFVMDGSVRVPRDVALIGYDDIDFASSAIVPFSSVRQPSRLIGETAMRILREETTGAATEPRDVLFEPELIVRASTAG
ncbi:LacI family DNA-binding transcriptional regulator [Microbacterium sp. Marseille-Q6965]|uniref:LacI family DNA-binding transcriptional regulator n=1 Tax=Microbacterium sp. Marseille-Q6965 TaxID=2965072 RepID=UPI0021B75E92|nr:LacI family DNA-binding transcriptional regulator [Microbacterium sp. Marseille-Q6965]